MDTPLRFQPAAANLMRSLMAELTAREESALHQAGTQALHCLRNQDNPDSRSKALQLQARSTAFSMAKRSIDGAFSYAKETVGALRQELRKSLTFTRDLYAEESRRHALAAMSGTAEHQAKERQEAFESLEKELAFTEVLELISQILVDAPTPA